MVSHVLLYRILVCLLTWFDASSMSGKTQMSYRPELVRHSPQQLYEPTVCHPGSDSSKHSPIDGRRRLVLQILRYSQTRSKQARNVRAYRYENGCNAQWSRTLLPVPLDTSDRSRIQNQLQCCGRFSPFLEATITQTCYARSILPGYKGPYLVFQTKLLD
ncbi:hypothetical protein BYT27DRAFT_7286602 [Phlegmacium glaucopus]|nr:hypothetical protein BYT27DRAFT_7307260 [Phlegmacium glaucopus]KAF8808566.1 hypothetical protein BYT27DRAFT_7286602 [Phlegmacium glaucopus]